MRRSAGLCVMLAALGGCVATEQGAPWTGGSGGSCSTGNCGASGQPPSIPGAVGPWGQPVAMAAPYSAAPPGGEAAAQSMMARSMPMDIVQAAGWTPAGGPSGVVQAGGPMGGMPAGGPGYPPPGYPAPGMPPQGMLTPPGVPFSPTAPGMAPGMAPPPVPGAVAAVGAFIGPVPSRFPSKRTEVRFAGPAGMKVSWYAPSPDGKPGFSGNQIEAPGRYNFVQAALYRLKLSDIPNRPGLELYPTLEVVPSNARTDAFLAHSAVPVVFTEEDFDQVVAGNFLVKVIYLPDPQFQDLATTGPDEVVSSRLDPGVDPLAEAHRRGNILLVVRMGNIDLEAPNTPAMDAPSPYAPTKPPVPPGGMPGHAMAPGLPQSPYAPMAGGNMVMGPNGPLMVLPNGALMGPNGQVMMPPQGPAGNPAAQPAPAMLPPTNPAVPAMPTGLQPAPQPAPATGGPVSQKTDKPKTDPTVTPAQYSTGTTSASPNSASTSSANTTTAPADATGSETSPYNQRPKPLRKWLFGN